MPVSKAKFQIAPLNPKINKILAKYYGPESWADHNIGELFSNRVDGWDDYRYDDIEREIHKTPFGEGEV